MPKVLEDLMFSDCTYCTCSEVVAFSFQISLASPMVGYILGEFELFLGLRGFCICLMLFSIKTEKLGSALKA